MRLHRRPQIGFDGRRVRPILDRIARAPLEFRGRGDRPQIREVRRHLLSQRGEGRVLGHGLDLVTDPPEGLGGKLSFGEHRRRHDLGGLPDPLRGRKADEILQFLRSQMHAGDMILGQGLGLLGFLLLRFRRGDRGDRDDRRGGGDGGRRRRRRDRGFRPDHRCPLRFQFLDGFVQRLIALADLRPLLNQCVLLLTQSSELGRVLGGLRRGLPHRRINLFCFEPNLALPKWFPFFILVIPNSLNRLPLATSRYGDRVANPRLSKFGLPSDLVLLVPRPQPLVRDILPGGIGHELLVQGLRLRAHVVADATP